MLSKPMAKIRRMTVLFVLFSSIFVSHFPFILMAAMAQYVVVSVSCINLYICVSVHMHVKSILVVCTRM